MKINEFTWEKIKKPILALAPMAGITDSPFRRICRDLGADVVYSEMVSVTGLFHNSPKSAKLLYFDQQERPLIVQLFGSNPEHFAFASKYITENIKPDGLDINFGCPVKDVIKTGAGCYLMKNLEKSREVLQAVLANTHLPVSVKARTQVGQVSILDFVEKIKDLKIKVLMIHGRSFSQKFSGLVNLELMKEVKKIFKGIVLANGNINNPLEVKKILEQTHCDGVGLARGVLGRPFLFTQVKQFLETNSYEKPDFSQIIRLILRQAKLMLEIKGEHGLIELRKHLGWYVQGFPGARILRNKLYLCTTLAQIEDILLENSCRLD